MLNMNEESLQSSSSSTPPSPTSTESSFLSSSNSENLNPTANWNLNDLLIEPTTTTFDDYIFPSSGTEGSDDGICEDNLCLNPSSERIVELQSDRQEKLGELMINRSPQDVLVLAETVCGESDRISIVQSFSNILNINGVQGEAYTERQELSFSSGNMEPVGVEYNSVAVTSSRSPVESEEIIASVDSSPSPMIRTPPPQLPLPRTNRDHEFDLDLEDIMIMEAIWLSIQEDSRHRNPVYGDAPSEQYATDRYVLPAMTAAAGSSPSPSGGLAWAIAALVKGQQIV